MTNADKFKQERIEDLETEIRYLQKASVDRLHNYIWAYLDRCEYCIEKNKDYCSCKCREGVEQWLEQEVEE